MRHAMKKGIVVVVIVISIGLTGLIIVYALGGNLSTIAALVVGLILGRLIPSVFNMGFQNELVMLKNHFIKWLHLQHEKIIGFPDSMEDGVMYYKKRDRLPLKDLLSEVEQRMDMLSISFTVLMQNIVFTYLIKKLYLL
jgi:hypothetical protein